MDLLIGYLKAFFLEMEGVDRRERVCTQWGGIVASVHVHTMGEGGQIFATLVRTY